MAEKERVSDRVYPDTIKRIQEIAADHENKADVYEALVHAYELLNMKKVSKVDNLTVPVYNLLMEPGGYYIELVDKCEKAIQTEQVECKVQFNVINNQLLEKMEQEKQFKLVIEEKDQLICNLNEVITNQEKKIHRLREEADLLEGMKKLLRSQGIQQTLFNDEESKKLS
ncbi:hypothetical protein ACFSCX_06625 [Bacillus salitolerans]|uniref:Uncharacterized protein n=1 Tax=Bacillus salitolerans TaxID=1437434 RepID=A0ABW4LNG4_9BACI